MSRYIEYEPLMAELEKEVELADDWKTAHEIANVVKYAPTIDAVSEWIPFKKRALTDEELKMFPDWCYILEGELPSDGQQILVSKCGMVWLDEWYEDGECGLDGGDDIEDGMAWMHLPKPWKGADQ